MSVSIWVDADACPNVIKSILFRAAQRSKIMTTLVANQPLSTPNSAYVRAIQVPPGFDVADNEIVRRANQGDLVVTQDIPLAAELIALGVAVITPRGERLTKENIGGRLNIRDFMDTMRASGVVTSGPPALSQQDRQAFANSLDSWIARQPKA